MPPFNTPIKYHRAGPACRRTNELRPVLPLVARPRHVPAPLPRVTHAALRAATRAVQPINLG